MNSRWFKIRFVGDKKKKTVNLVSLSDAVSKVQPNKGISVVNLVSTTAVEY